MGAFECLPLGILQIIYSLRVAEHSPEKSNVMGMFGSKAIIDDHFCMCSGKLSLVTSWFMFGSKVAKVISMLILIFHFVQRIDVQVPELHHLWEYREASTYFCMHGVHIRMPF